VSTTNPTTTITTAAKAIDQATTVTTLVANLQTAARNGATEVPEAVHTIAQLDPDLADKAATQSKTLYGIILVQLITAGVHHFNLGWAPDVITEVAGGLILIWLRLITSGPITSMFRKAPVVAALRPGA
jgi:hypothetical protein